MKIKVPDDWPYEHIPTFYYDEDGEPEVDNLYCQLCAHKECKCIDHKWVHFFRPWFSCDVLTEHHTICSAFIFDDKRYPAGKLIWDAIGGFDEWLRLWRKQWHPRRKYDYAPTVSLIRAKQVDGREHSDDMYYVSYDDFVNCNIMRPEGIHCLNYSHIERSRQSPIGYKWVYEGPGIWIPWEDNKYEKRTI